MQQGFRVAADLRNEKIGFKFVNIPNAFPYWLLATGNWKGETVAVRTRAGRTWAS